MLTMLKMGVCELGVGMEGEESCGWYLTSLL